MTRILLALALAAHAGTANADERLQAARQSIAEFDWKRAIRLFPAVRDAAPVGGDVWLETTYCLAAAYHHVQPPDASTIGAANQLYQELVDRAPGTKWAARALLNQARILELRDYPDDVLDLEGALALYQRVAREFSADPISGEATLRAAAVLVMSYDAPDYARVRQGIALLESWLEQRPDEPLASVMWQYLGDTYFRPLNDYANALRCYEETDRLGWVDKGNQGPWYWRCAQLAERYLDQPDTAAKYYTKIIIETPNSGKGYESILALRRLNKPVPHSSIFERVTSTTQEAKP